jgi:replicative DNA helicase
LEVTTFNHELELASVCAMLDGYARFSAQGLCAEDFTLPLHIALFNAAQRVYESGGQVSGRSVALEMQRAGQSDLCGGEDGLAKLRADFICRPSPPMADADALKALRGLRAISEVAGRAHRLAASGDREGALAALSDAAQFGSATGDGIMDANKLAASVVESVRDQARNARSYVSLGMKRLGLAVGRMNVGSMLVVAADTNVGKSGFVLSMLVAMAREGTCCGLISSEDPADTTGARLLGYFGDVSARELQIRGVPDQGSMGRLTAAVDGLAKLGDKLLFEDCIGKNDLDVRASMTGMAARGAKLIVVDYIGEVACSVKQQDRRNEMRHVAKALKAHARRIGVVLVIVSQIARPKAEDEFECPSKHSLKESGDITNMAEVVIALWRAKAEDSEPVSAKVVKAKSGGNGVEWTLRRDRNFCLREVE